MTRKSEPIELSIPSKSIHIGHARCPQGCDLMDPKTPINGFPSIMVEVAWGDHFGLLHMDPVYGSYNNISQVNMPLGEIAAFACPHCGASLQSDHDSCSICSAPMFALQLPKGGIVVGCLRNGCKNHALRLISGEELMKGLFETRIMDNYL